jgi:hypothetical protein
MKERTTLVIALIIVLVLLSLFFLGRSQPSNAIPDTVILKDKSKDNGVIQGEVIKQDTASRYVVIKKADNALQPIAWDEIESISQTKRPWYLKLGNLDNWTRVLPIITILVGAVGFTIAYGQYKEARTWKRVEFLANTVKEFNSNLSVQNAKQMLDSMWLDGSGRKIKLYPDNEPATARYETVTNIETHNALVLQRPNTFSDKEKAIADCFDVFLGWLERFNSYLTSGLVKKEELELYIIYWLRLIGGTKPLFVPEFRGRLLEYAKHYGFTEVDDLLSKYQLFTSSTYTSD